MNSLLAALVGGMLIGAAAAALLLLRGQVAGISGAFGNLVLGKVGDGAWRLAFVAGLLAAIPVYMLGGGPRPPIELAVGPVGAVVAGLLVGAGTGRGNGCTSGHGVCGLANLSWRSLTATVTFMAVAAFTVFVRRHLLGA
jgi:uncharacterized membrane protein YedE/YeeE